MLELVSTTYITYVKNYIDKYVQNNNRLPKKKEINGEIAIEELLKTYGSWKKSLFNLGYIKEEVEPSSKETLNKIINLQKEINKVPNKKNIKEKNINLRPLLNEYNSWKEIKKFLKQNFKNKVHFKEKKELKEKIIEITNKNEKMPTIKTLKENNISLTKIKKNWGNWQVVKEKLDLNSILINNTIKQISNENDKSLKRLTLKELKDKKINIRPILKKYNSWKNACVKLNIPLYNENIIKKEIVNLTKSLNKRPSLNKIKSEKIPIKYLFKKGYKWKDIVRDLSLDSYEEKEAIKRIQSLFEKIDKTPTIKEMKSNGININKLLKKYQGWNNFRKIIGLPKYSSYTNNEKNYIKKDILDLSKQIGKSPTLKDIKVQGIKISSLINQYGSWNNLLKHLGLKCNNKYTEKDITKCINKILELYSIKGIAPTVKEMKENGIHVNILRKKYGSITDCLLEIGITPRVLQNKFYNKEFWLRKVQEISNKIGKKPSLNILKKKNIKVYGLIKAYGSWEKVKSKIFVNTNEKENIKIQEAI